MLAARSVAAETSSRGKRNRVAKAGLRYVFELKRLARGIQADSVQSFAAVRSESAVSLRMTLPVKTEHLLDGNGLGQVPGLVYITATPNSDVIRQQLQGNDLENG